MTIQRPTLCALALLVLTLTGAGTANAQCSRTRTLYSSGYGGYHHHHAQYPVHVPVTVHHPVYTQTAMLPSIPSSTTFGSYGHVDELAFRLEILLNELCLDLYYNYSHNPGFAETYAETFGLYQIAKSIHAAEHNYDRNAVRQQLAGADSLFHHIQGDVSGWSRNSHVQIGTLGIITKMSMAEETLHHLMEDVGVSVAASLQQPPVPNVPPAPTAAPLPFAVAPAVAPQSVAVAPVPPTLP
ncbi:MAG: hypothetical protein R3C49_17330 [Planctomycetaceae bacterium]